MKDSFSSDTDLVRQTDTCPDCIARDDVDLIGRPRRGRAGRIRICMGCGGHARVRREKPDVISWYVSLRERES